MSESGRTDSLIAFLFGTAVGAGIALLLAPQTGEETRRRIGDAARKLGEDAQDKLAGLKEEVRHRAGDVRTAVDAGKDAYRRIRSEEPAPTSTAM